MTQAPDPSNFGTRGHRAAIPERSDALDLSQLWATVRQHYRFVAAVGAVVFVAVMAITLASRMSFRSVGRLYLGELEEGSPAAARANEVAISANNQGVIGSEIEIIQSRSLVSRAVLESGLNVTIVDPLRAPPRYGPWLLSRRDPSLLDAATGELRATNSVLTDRFGTMSAYRVRFASETEYEVLADERRVARGRLGESLDLPGAKLTLVAGDRAPKPGSAYEVTVRSLQDVTTLVLSALQVSAPKPLPPAQPVNVVTLELSGHSPRLVAMFLERLMAAYLAERQSWKAEDATAAERFVSDQLQKTRASLDEIQSRLADYRSHNRVVVMDDEAKAMIEQIGKYEEQRVAARLEVAALSEFQRSLKGDSPPVTAFLLGQANDSVIERLAGSLSEARQKLTDLESRFNDAAPDVRTQREQVNAQLQAIRGYVASRNARAQENLSVLNGIIKQFETKLSTVPGAEVGLAQLSRESDVYDRMYSFLLERQQQTAIIKASTLSKNRVLDAPELAVREDSPKLLMRLLSLPLGLLSGVLLVLARSFMAGTLQSEADARGVTGPLPVFASLPWRAKRLPKFASELDGLAGDGSSFAEAFRTLRAHLYRLNSIPAGRVVLVTSPGEGDGKTTCTLALAAALIADGKRVIVVDANLHKVNHPSQPDTAHHGLKDIAQGKCSWPDALTQVTSVTGQLWVVGSGGVGPTELLSNGKIAEFLAEARLRCDFILLDGASFPLVSDALVLSSLVDVVLSVLRMRNTSRQAASAHLSQLSALGLAHAVVLNDLGIDRPLSMIPREQPATRVSPPRVAWRRMWWVSALILLACAAAFLLSGRAMAGGASANVQARALGH